MSDIVMEKEQCYGVYSSESFDATQFDLSMSVRVPIPHVSIWSKCSLIANFIADYHGESQSLDKSRLVSIISTIANELIENAVKFTEEGYDSLEVSLKKWGSHIIIETINVSHERNVASLKSIFETMASSPIEELLLKHITDNAIHNEKKSEIGLISIAKDYSSEIGAKIKPLGKDALYQVSVCVVCDINNGLLLDL